VKEFREAAGIDLSIAVHLVLGRLGGRKGGTVGGCGANNLFSGLHNLLRSQPF
jgi:hypothetical protein